MRKPHRIRFYTTPLHSDFFLCGVGGMEYCERLTIQGYKIVVDFEPWFSKSLVYVNNRMAKYCLLYFFSLRDGLVL